VQAAAAALAVAGVMLAVSDAGAENAATDFPVGVDDVALKFTPETIEISTGDTVVWDFTGSTTVHNVVSENVVAADENWEKFATAPASTGQFRYTFNAVGEYEYVCDLHRVQGMVGKVTVVDGPVATPTATPDKTPRPLVTATPSVVAAAPTRDTPAPTGAAAADKTAPALTKVSGARSGKTAARIKWTLSETAALTIKFTKGTKSTKVLRTVRLAGRPGTSAVTVRGAKLTSGRYTVQIEARDRAGNRSTARTTVRIGR